MKTLADIKTEAAMSLSIDELRRIVRWFDIASNEGEIDKADVELADRIESAVEATVKIES